MSVPYYPDTLWSEIIDGLYQGGTDEYDELGAQSRGEGLRGFAAIRTQVTKRDFDTVVTAYSQANPAGSNVKELRFTFHDGDMKDFDPERDLTFLVREAHSDWKAGKKVLIRCQAGINRSGLITALVLIRDGHTPREAIDLIRSTRCEGAITNTHFEEYLLNVADVNFWRMGIA
jgi:predicted protein tyrosine phosphatase